MLHWLASKHRNSKPHKKKPKLSQTKLRLERGLSLLPVNWPRRKEAADVASYERYLSTLQLWTVSNRFQGILVGYYLWVVVAVLLVFLRLLLTPHSRIWLASLLPPLLPTADCPQEGKEEHQQTETLPVMDKNPLLHHTHHIQWVSRVILPDLFRWKRKSTRTRELRWQLSGFAEGKLLRGEEWNSDTFCHKSGPWSAFEWHKILSLNRKFWETLSIANFQSMPRRYRLFFCSNQGILAW